MAKPIISPTSRDLSGNSDKEESSSEEEAWIDWKDKILEETVPLVGFVRMLLHSGRYESGGRLDPKHETTILERLLPYHPEFEKKIGCGIDYITLYQELTSNFILYHSAVNVVRNMNYFSVKTQVAVSLFTVKVKPHMHRQDVAKETYIGVCNMVSLLARLKDVIAVHVFQLYWISKVSHIARRVWKDYYAKVRLNLKILKTKHVVGTLANKILTMRDNR
ncbi:hypothetical protein Dsin_017474 [Dipteronia sinensis]|uniref:Uncharacterized protein n=1 Tax=Dipteronia sinensis TaxID=43782 RepID=A0AAE0E7X8_9ROSI|nr:hypothetical protein Dsin_017474 [Dipteronia sinensis]